MYDYIWEIFKKTGNVKTYLLLSVLEKEDSTEKRKNINNVIN